VVVPRTQAWGLSRDRRPRARYCPAPPPEPAATTPWKTQCAPSILSTAECSSMECRSIDQSFLLAIELCWSWSPIWATWCMEPGPDPVGLGGLARAEGASASPRSRLPLPQRPRGPRSFMHRSQTMGPFRVKDIAAPEVKFLDRCTINRSEGAWQVRVRRSRMRVRGAKMIRHRRSPAL